MSPLQVRILEAVRRAGPGGMPGDVLYALVWDGRLPRYQGGRHGKDGDQARTVLKANVWRINRAIAASGWRIVGERCSGGWYTFVKQNQSVNSRGELYG